MWIAKHPYRAFGYCTAALLSMGWCAAPLSAEVEPLHVDGDQFVNARGEPVRFWGVNLVSLYPTHEQAENLAENLASLQVNLVRPHHMLRSSGDWVTTPGIVSLQNYDGTTRTPNPKAWDRFDYLNAQLRDRGIYLMLALEWTRRFQPGDVDILTTNDADREAWMAAMEELNSWDWRKAMDLRKMLPVIDERAAALEEEFARQLLTHVNPYTGLSYAEDPQVLTIETINELSSEYTIICNNRFPEYWQRKLDAKWQAFAEAHGAVGGDLYHPANQAITNLRARFLRGLDEAFFKRMQAVVREAGSDAAMTFSNLWRGENALQMHAQNAGYIEDHLYIDPLVVREADDLFLDAARTQIRGMPYIIGELNISQGGAARQRAEPVRTMLPLAIAAYGSLQNWSGVAWFAWMHGDRPLGDDGWAAQETRDASIGDLIRDGMQIDHFRTAGLMFRQHLVAPSTDPILIHVEDPLTAGDYDALMRPKVAPAAGWQNIHGIRKTFGPAPADQAHAPWMSPPPPGVLVSDTGEIRKDIQRQQLTVSAPGAEAFSGVLDGRPPAGLRRLRIDSPGGFATVILVAADGRPIEQSRHLIISRTARDDAQAEVVGPAVRLAGLRNPSDAHWSATLTRPRHLDPADRSPIPLTFNAQGELTLPTAAWHEAELFLTP